MDVLKRSAKHIDLKTIEKVQGYLVCCVNVKGRQLYTVFVLQNTILHV